MDDRDEPNSARVLLELARNELGDGPLSLDRVHANAILHLATRAAEVGCLDLAVQWAAETDRPAEESALALVSVACRLAAAQEDIAQAKQLLAVACTRATSRIFEDGLTAVAAVTERLYEESRPEWADEMLDAAQRAVLNIVDGSATPAAAPLRPRRPEVSNRSLLAALAELQMTHGRLACARRTLRRLETLEECELGQLDARQAALHQAVEILARCGRFAEAHELALRAPPGPLRAALLAMALRAQHHCGSEPVTPAQLQTLDLELAQESSRLVERYVRNSLDVPETLKVPAYRLGDVHLLACEVAAAQHAMDDVTRAIRTLRCASRMSAALRSKFARERPGCLGTVALWQGRLGDDEGLRETAKRMLAALAALAATSDGRRDEGTLVIGVMDLVYALAAAGERETLLALLREPGATAILTGWVDMLTLMLIAEGATGLAATFVGHVSRLTEANLSGGALVAFAARYGQRADGEIFVAERLKLIADVAADLDRPHLFHTVCRHVQRACRRLLLDDAAQGNGEREGAAGRAAAPLLSGAFLADCLVDVYRDGTRTEARVLVETALRLLAGSGDDRAARASLAELAAVAITHRDPQAVDRLCRYLDAPAVNGVQTVQIATEGEVHTTEDALIERWLGRLRTGVSGNEADSLLRRVAVLLSCTGRGLAAVRVLADFDARSSKHAALLAIASIAAERAESGVVQTALKAAGERPAAGHVRAAIGARLLAAGHVQEATVLLERLAGVSDPSLDLLGNSDRLAAASAYLRASSHERAAELAFEAAPSPLAFSQPPATSPTSHELHLKHRLLELCLVKNLADAIDLCTKLGSQVEWKDAWGTIRASFFPPLSLEDALEAIERLPPERWTHAARDICEVHASRGARLPKDTVARIERSADPGDDATRLLQATNPDLAPLVCATLGAESALRWLRDSVRDPYRAVRGMFRIARQCRAAGDRDGAKRVLGEAHECIEHLSVAWQQNPSLLPSAQPVGAGEDTGMQVLYAEDPMPYALVQLGDTLWDLSERERARAAYESAFEAFFKALDPSYKVASGTTHYALPALDSERALQARVTQLIAIRVRMGALARAQRLASLIGSGCERARMLADIALAAHEHAAGRQHRISIAPMKTYVSRMNFER